MLDILRLKKLKLIIGLCVCTSRFKKKKKKTTNLTWYKYYNLKVTLRLACLCILHWGTLYIQFFIAEVGHHAKLR